MSSTECPSPRSTSPMAFFNSNPAWSEPITIFITGSLSHRFFCRRYNVFNREAEFRQQVLQWCGSSKRAHADDFALGSNVTVPSENGSHLHAHACGHRCGQYALFICRILFFEQLKGRNTHHSGFHAPGRQLFLRGHTERNFSAGSHQDYIRLTIRRVTEYIRSL